MLALKFQAPLRSGLWGSVYTQNLSLETQRAASQPWNYRYFDQMILMWGLFCGTSTHKVPVASPSFDNQRYLLGVMWGCRITPNCETTALG